MADRDYPRMLYRQADEGHVHESAPGADDGLTCEHRIVESAEEEDDAKAEGFAASPREAHGLEAPLQSPQPGDADERANLRAEYEAKAGKKPFTGWSADQLRERIAALPVS